MRYKVFAFLCFGEFEVIKIEITKYKLHLMVETWDFKWHQLRKKENNIMMIFLLKIRRNLKFEETWTRGATVIMACNDTASSPAEASRLFYL